MVLLTSSQVSVAITSAIIFLFTLALFLSGYVIQQQTVRDLRAAIKPHVNPPILKPHLPAQFAIAKPSPKVHVGADGVAYTVELGGEEVDRELRKRDSVRMVDQRLFDLPPEEKMQGAEKEGTGEEEEKVLTRAERRKRYKKALTAGSEEEGFKGYRRRMW